MHKKKILAGAAIGASMAAAAASLVFRPAPHVGADIEYPRGQQRTRTKKSTHKRKFKGSKAAKRGSKGRK